MTSVAAVVRRCAVLGDPVAHSLSPALHRAAYAELGLAWTYDAVRVPEGGAAALVAGLDTSWRGLSVTMPLKREVLALADVATDRARLAGGANTLLLTPDGVHADNTDLPGAAAAVRERYAGPVTDVVVLGAGATAASVALALVDLGARRVRLLAREPARAGASARSVRAHPDAPEVRVGRLDDPQERGSAGGPVDVVVSTVPAAAQDAGLVSAWADVPLVFEAVYDPWPTPLAAAAETAGAALVSGLDLLTHQAALQVLAFTGAATSVDLLRRAGLAELAARAARA